MEGYKLKLVNGVQRKEHTYSNFEKSDILSIECDKIVNIDEIKVYRGLCHMGVSIKQNLISLDINGLNKGFMKFDVDIQTLSCSSDGRFLLVLLKNKYIYLIYVPTMRIIYKELIVMNECDFVKRALMLTLNDQTSEIWIFLKESLVIYRNLNLCDIEKTMHLDNQIKIKLFSQIKKEKCTFPFLRRDELVHIRILKCKRVDQFLMAIMYSDFLVVIHGHFEHNMSYIDCTYESHLSRLGVSVRIDEPCMEISSDETHVFFLDEHGAVWILNFRMGCVSEVLIADTGSYVDVTLSPSLTVIKQKCNNNHIILNFLSFPFLENIESFEISRDSIIFPILQDDAPILVFAKSDINNQLIFLKSFRKLDPDIRLQEIIETNNFEYAFKFADIFRLNKEKIYIQQLKYTIVQMKDIDILSTDQCSLVFECLKEIKSFFDVQDFEQLLSVVIMTSKEQHELFLRQLQNQTNNALPSEDSAIFICKIEREIHKFDIFKLFGSRPGFIMSSWKDFRDMSSVHILYSMISIENVDMLYKVWPKIKYDIDSIFTSESCFFEKVSQLVQIMVAQHFKIFDIDRFICWFITNIFSQQMDICPRRLYDAVKRLESILIMLEATHDIMYHNLCIKMLNVAEKLFINMKFSSKKAQLEAAGLMSLSEQFNPAQSIAFFQDQMLQLDRLNTMYNLHLNLDLLIAESKLSLAFRLLDQISTNDLSYNKDLSKLKDFLNEFQLSHCEFFYSYIKKITLNISVTTDEDLENRFIILLNNIPERQLQLECLIEFATKAEVPYKVKLNELIKREISSNSENNPAVLRLQLLIRKSNMTPLLNRYGLHYDVQKPLIPAIFLRRMLRKELSMPLGIINDDIERFVNEYKVDELIVINVKCSVYVSNIIYEDEMVVSNSVCKLKVLINCDSYPLSMRKKIINNCFQNLMTLINLQVTMSYSKLSLVLGVARWITSKFHCADQELQWKETFDTLLFCLSLRFDHLDESLNLADFICQNDISSMTFGHCRLSLIKKCFLIKMTKAISAVTSMNTYTFFDVSNKIARVVSDIETLCIQSYMFMESFLPEIYQQVFYELISGSLQKDQHLACCILYGYLTLVLKWNIAERSEREPCFNQIVLLCLEDVGCLRSDIYLLWSILTILSKVLALHIIHGINYLNKDFAILLCVANFVTSVSRVYAELETPNHFETLKFNEAYHEIINNNYSFHKIIPLIQCGINVMSSTTKDLFRNNVDMFAKEVLNSLSTFSKEGMILKECNATLNVLSIIFNDKNVNLTKLLKRFEIHSKRKMFLHILDDVLKSPQIDQIFAISVLLFLPQSVVIDQMKLAIKNCKSSTKVLNISAIIIEMVVINKEIFSMEDIKKFFKDLLLEVRKHYWVKHLKPYNIKMLRSSDKSHLKVMRFEMLQNVNVPVDLVENFVVDYDLFEQHANLELFRDLFKTEFNDCSSFYSYKIKVESLLKRAEQIWTSIPIHEKDYSFVDNVCHSIISWTSPYHYEILQYVFERLHSVSFLHEYENKVIKLLFHWNRTSPISEVERKHCQEFYVEKKLADPLSAKYLIQKRLPYNLVDKEKTMVVLEKELHSTNVNLWVSMYSLLSKFGTHSKADINPDMLQLQAVENLFSNFIKYSCPVNEMNRDDSILFLGNLYETSSAWFNETLSRAMDLLETLLIKCSFVEIVKKTLLQLCIGEQRLRLIDISLEWINKCLFAVPCFSKTILEDWKEENLILKQRLQIEKLLFENNLCKTKYLELMSNCTDLLDNILKFEVMVSVMFEPAGMKMIRVLKQIAHIGSVDLEEFVFNMVVDTLNLSNVDPQLNNSSDHDRSILNTSVDSTTVDYKVNLDINYNVHTERIELLSWDSQIKEIIKRRLLDFLNNNLLNLEQWLNVFIYLFRSFQNSDEVVINKLCNIHTFSVFLLVIELHFLEAGVASFGDCDLSMLLEYLDNFCHNDNTEIVKRLCYGSVPNKTQPKELEPLTERVVEAVKDLLKLCPETVDMSDVYIKYICSRLQ